MLRTFCAPLLALVLAATTLRAQDSARVAGPRAKSPTAARVIGTIYDAGRAAERANARQRWLRVSLIVAPDQVVGLEVRLPVVGR